MSSLFVYNVFFTFTTNNSLLFIGVQFVPVDMRWGITTELSDNNQTINICLREIDRSDVFIGFYGQVCPHFIFVKCW